MLSGALLSPTFTSASSASHEGTGEISSTEMRFFSTIAVAHAAASRPTTAASGAGLVGGSSAGAGVSGADSGGCGAG